MSQSNSRPTMFHQHAAEVEMLSADQQRRLLAAVQQGQVASERLERGVADPTVQRRLEAEVRTARRARERLVCANMKLVAWVVDRLTRRSRWLDRDDLIQEGVSGLTRAIEKFDLSMGTALSTYATLWIRQSVTRAILNANLVRIPVHVGDGTNTNPFVIRCARRFDEIDSIDELLETLDEAEAEMVALGDLDDWPDAGLDPDRGLAIQDDFVGDFEAATLAHDVLANLDSREAYILASRHGLHGVPMTLEQIGLTLGITRERVRQIEHAALASARSRLTKAA